MDGDGVEPERAEERQARPLDAPVARVPGAAERHNNSDEAVGCNLVPPCPPRLVLAPYPRHHPGLAVAHELQSCVAVLQSIGLCWSCTVTTGVADARAAGAALMQQY